MTTRVPIDDWRRQGQESFLKNVTLVYKHYEKYRDGWDHDHCEFCGATFSAYEGDLHEGYATNENYHWICSKCYNDFWEEFGWMSPK